MKKTLQSDLLHDHLLTAVARRRRRRQVPYIVTTLAIFFAIFVLFPKSQNPPPAAASQEKETSSDYHTISTEDELMDTLAHLGPVIVTRQDGSRWLYLTKQEQSESIGLLPNQ